MVSKLKIYVIFLPLFPGFIQVFRVDPFLRRILTHCDNILFLKK